MKLLTWITNNRSLLILLFVSFFFRIYNFQELFYYGHDNDLAGWIIKDVVENRHLRLIGQETSTSGIFIGPLFYYLQIPFYLLTGMDPIGATFLVAFLGTFAVWSIYYVFGKIWNTRIGYMGAFIYALSFSTIFTDREVVPTMPVMLWTIWYLYGLWLLMNGKQRQSWILLGLLLGLIWHLNFALVLVLPLILIAFLLQKRKEKQHIFIDGKGLFFGLLILGITSLPLVIFEFRHDFQQTNALLNALTTDQHDIVSGYEKFARTFHLASKNVANLLFGSVFDIRYEITHIIVLLLGAFLLFKNKVDRRMGSVMYLWIVLFITFFSLYSKILSEYYLNGATIIYIAICAILLSTLFSSMKWRYVGWVLITLFAAINMYRFFSVTINKSGYVHRKAVVQAINKDALEKGYPCISVSYITDPGNNLGYRYFFWLENMHVNQPDSGSPVYTIVFPLKPIFKEDQSFGAIGLIYPDYNRYNVESVKESCSGQNSNLTDPMFGYTE
jgi:4-amino-4-deoxy-L-arabinose transferase-like glycosyltransferase